MDRRKAPCHVEHEIYSPFSGQILRHATALDPGVTLTQDLTMAVTYCLTIVLTDRLTATCKLYVANQNSVSHGSIKQVRIESVLGDELKVPATTKDTEHSPSEQRFEIQLCPGGRLKGGQARRAGV